MLTIIPREAPSLVAGRVTVYHYAQTRQSLSTGHSSAILSQSGAGPTAPGPLQYHTTLAYHHDKKTPIHLFITGLTMRAYPHARGTLRRRSYSPSLYRRARGTCPPMQVFQVVIVCLHVDVLSDPCHTS